MSSTSAGFQALTMWRRLLGLVFRPSTRFGDLVDRLGRPARPTSATACRRPDPARRSRRPIRPRSCTPLSCRHCTLVSPRRNHSSSTMIELAGAASWWSAAGSLGTGRSGSAGRTRPACRCRCGRRAGRRSPGCRRAGSRYCRSGWSAAACSAWMGAMAFMARLWGRIARMGSAADRTVHRPRPLIPRNRPRRGTPARPPWWCGPGPGSDAGSGRSGR